MSAPVNGDMVSAAVVAYLGWGRGPHPAADAQAVADLAHRHGVPASDLARAVEHAIAAANTIRVDELAPEAGSRFASRLRALLPSLEDDAVAALTSRAFWYARWDGGEPPPPRISPGPDRQAAHAATGETPAPREYWRHSTSLGPRYFAFSAGHDFILRSGEWMPYDRYKSGPSWWRLTGETDANVVDRSELPPGTPD
ncbi:hypothetical protein ACF044_08805 [Microbacterium sp. NPDC016588]